MPSPSLESIKWYEYLSALFDLSEGAEIPEKLAKALQYLSRADSVLVMIYYPDKLPALLYADIDHNCRKNNFDEYLQGFYLLDPFYQMATHCEQATLFHLKDICENSFYDSEYYESWYKQSGLRDEVNYLIPMENAAVCALSLSRNLENSFFSEHEINQLKVIMPLMATMIGRYGKVQDDDRAKRKGDEVGLHQALSKAMDNFASSLLTEREGEIVQFLLRGYSIKATAQKLNIAPSTIKVHRKHIYKKLDISSHSELFSLFIGALSVVRQGEEKDPLLRYHLSAVEAD